MTRCPSGEKDSRLHGDEAVSKVPFLAEWAVFEEVCHRMDNERAALLKRYPREWVAVGKGGLIDHSESVEDLVDSVQSRGVRSWEYQLKFLDPHPPLFLL